MAVGSKMLHQLQNELFYTAVFSTFLRVLSGFVIALLTALITALLTYLYPVIADYLYPLLLLTRSVPNISYILIVLFWSSPKTSVIVISFLILAGNFALFFFKTILARERKEKAALQEHNRLAQMQLRNQRDMGELYENIRMLRHDISSHLTAIFGYIELERYQKARDYIEELRKEMDSLEPVHTGNVTLDALLGSKGVLARKNSISVELDAAVPPDLWMEETHLAVMLM